MENYNRVVEDLLIKGRSMSEDDFDKYLDYYFANKSDSEKEKIGEETFKIKLSRLDKIKKIDNEISFLKLPSRKSLRRTNKRLTFKIAQAELIKRK